MTLKSITLMTGFLISGVILTESLTPAQAATIGQLSLGENNTVIDSDQNLVWLKLTESVNKSINDIIANPSRDGYRLATGAEVTRLFSGLVNNDAARFSELFGKTFNLGITSLSVGLYSPDDSTTTAIAGAYNFSFGNVGFGGLVDPTNLGSFNDQAVPFAGVFQVQPVPEPITIIGSGIALGFGATLKRKLGKKTLNKSKPA
ncbi:MAG: PEP-CTERM sorting domain-containing protein [Snowella sp.]|nr:PEP-CTERM sorting domain-containing protein [Snowella sp.]